MSSLLAQYLRPTPINIKRTVVLPDQITDGPEFFIHLHLRIVERSQMPAYKSPIKSEEFRYTNRIAATALIHSFSHLVAKSI
jgi:hypothetical protein